jgi:hypothetical protein
MSVTFATQLTAVATLALAILALVARLVQIFLNCCVESPGTRVASSRTGTHSTVSTSPAFATRASPASTSQGPVRFERSLEASN